jgi:hypothetical protein
VIPTASAVAGAAGSSSSCRPRTWRLPARRVLPAHRGLAERRACTGGPRASTRPARSCRAAAAGAGHAARRTKKRASRNRRTWHTRKTSWLTCLRSALIWSHLGTLMWSHLGAVDCLRVASAHRAEANHAVKPVRARAHLGGGGGLKYNHVVSGLLAKKHVRSFFQARSPRHTHHVSWFAAVAARRRGQVRQVLVPQERIVQAEA